MSLEQALKYPNSTEWVNTHDAELYQLDYTETIHWLAPDFSPPTRPLPTTMGYRYKWTTGLQLLKRKARASLRGDLMIPYFHYDPAYLCAPMASTTSVRLLFGLNVHLGLYMEHFDITAAFLHEAFGYYQAFYVP